MKRFLEWFYEVDASKLVERINKYAEKNNLLIISLTATENQHGAIVLFEGKRPAYKW